ncbi:hypothetical protein Ptr902_08603 [Pyrenophora tritici-repentis]|nr:hypothetical protein Ptr902_08603 [Pyrenophora tritici-repentis]
MNLGIFCFYFKSCPNTKEPSSPARLVPQPILPRAITTSPTGRRSSRGSLKSDSTLELAVRGKDEIWGLHQEDLDMHLPIPAASYQGLSTSCIKSTEDLHHDDGSGKIVLKKNYQGDVSAEWERRYDMKYGSGQR